MNGRAELFKLVLSQQSPATLGRMLVYFDYFNRARSARIGAVSAEVAELADLGDQSERATAELASLEAAESAQVASLEHARDERRAVVAKLDAGIADANEKINKARADEKRLSDLVAELTRLMAGFPADGAQPFGRLKGKLAWPVVGRLAGEYGQPREGGTVKWNGVLIEASQGTPVRAIYRGRVAFADWLPGLGLLLVLDHGDGYMSLYGHNQSLLKEPGRLGLARRDDRAGRRHWRPGASRALFRNPRARRARESARLDQEARRPLAQGRSSIGTNDISRSVSGVDWTVLRFQRTRSEVE